MYKTVVYTLVNGGIQGLTIKNSKNHKKVILPASHWLCQCAAE